MKERLFTRNFTFLILGQVSSLLGNYTLKFALSMYVLEQTGSAAVYAGLLAAAMVPMILLSPLGGILADRKNRRNIMVALDSLSGIFVLAVFFLFQNSSGIVLTGILLVLLSVLGAFESPTVQACVPQMQSGDNILRGNAVVNQVNALAALVTPFLGSLFYTAVGIRLVLFTTALCFFMTAALECFIRLEYHRSEEAWTVFQIIRKDFMESMDFLIKKEPGVLKLLLLAAAASFFVIGTAVVGFPFLVRTVLGLSANYYGAAESIMGIAAVAGSIMVSFLAGKLKTGRLHLLIAFLGLCLLPAGAVFLFPGNALGRYIILVLMFGAGQFVCSIFSIFSLSVIQERTPESLTGKVMSYVYTISMCAQPLGQLLYGFLFDAFYGAVWLVLIPTGLVLCGIAAAASGFFKKLA